MSASVLGTSLTPLTTSPSICHPEQTPPGRLGCPLGPRRCALLRRRGDSSLGEEGKLCVEGGKTCLFLKWALKVCLGFMEGRR